jgi:hypothetical protein
VRVRHAITRIGWLLAATSALLTAFAGSASAQVEITPETSITPSSHVTSWIYQMAIACAVMGVLILLAIALGYLRFAPKFYGREERPRTVPPGSRPGILARQAAAVRWTPPPASAGHAAAAPAPAARATATAVAERPTAGPQGEPAVQADAVGAAEAAAPEPRPSAKTPEEVGVAPEEAAAQPPAAQAPAEAPAAQAPAEAPAEAPSKPAAAAPSPAPGPEPRAAAGVDQETFDRVLEEQLGKGVDRRVAEGRARAAAVVAARKKAQG